MSTTETVQEITERGGFVYRHKKIVFNGGKVPGTPQREGSSPDKWDMVFNSKEEFDVWYKRMIAGLAELDQCMNYCKYFIREKGNEGSYVREGKSYPVNGSWCGTHDYGRDPFLSFWNWIVANGWENDWYALMDRYIYA